MDIMQLMLVAASSLEVILLVVIVLFFVRLKRSESLIAKMKKDQQQLLQNLSFNAQLESELINSFSQRQEELSQLDKQLQEKIDEIKGLLQEADEISRSPGLIRQIILSGYKKKGHTPGYLAQKTGLSVDEVEWIIAQYKDK